MRFNTANTFELERLQEFIKRNTGKKLDVSLVRYIRTSAQNRYYWLLQQVFAMEYGCRLDIAHMMLKESQPVLYPTTTYKAGDILVKQYKSSKDLTVSEMTSSIEQYKEWARDTVGITLPEATNREQMEYYQDLIAQNEGNL